MKIRIRRRTQEIARDFTSMIDIVFLLLVFFMLTMQIREPEGDLPIHFKQAGEGAAVDPAQPIRIRLISRQDGSLAEVRLGARSLGSGPAAIDRLRNEMRRFSASAVRNGIAGGLDVEIESDDALHYAHSLSVISTCSGERDTATGQVVRYAEKVRLAPRRAAIR